MKKETIKLTVTVPLALNEKIEELSEKEQRSKNNLVNLILKKFFDAGGDLNILKKNEL